MVTRRNFVQKALSCFTFSSMPLAVLPTLVHSGKKDFDKLQELLKGTAPLKWVFTGDSITQGAKHTLGYRSYPEVFTERVRYEMSRVRDFVINTAVSGNTSRDILDDFDWRIAQFRPSVVSVMIGTNDASVQKKITVNNFEKNIVDLISNIRITGAMPILQTPNIIIEKKATGRERLADYVAVINDVARKHEVILIDHWSFWKESLASLGEEIVYGKWLNDPLHPNGKGHVKMAQLLFKELAIFDSNAFTGKDL